MRLTPPSNQWQKYMQIYRFCLGSQTPKKGYHVIPFWATATGKTGASQIIWPLSSMKRLEFHPGKITNTNAAKQWQLPTLGIWFFFLESPVLNKRLWKTFAFHGTITYPTEKDNVDWIKVPVGRGYVGSQQGKYFPQQFSPFVFFVSSFLSLPDLQSCNYPAWQDLIPNILARSDWMFSQHPKNMLIKLDHTFPSCGPQQ